MEEVERRVGVWWTSQAPWSLEMNQGYLTYAAARPLIAGGSTVRGVLRVMEDHSAAQTLAWVEVKALEEAAGRGDLHAMEALVDVGVSPRGEGPYQPLRSAASSGSISAIDWLLGRDAVLEPEDLLEPLCFARKVKVVKVLLEACASMGAVASIAGQALPNLIANSRTSVVRALLAAGADPNVRSGGETSIQTATRHRRFNIIPLLLARASPKDIAIQISEMLECVSEAKVSSKDQKTFEALLRTPDVNAVMAPPFHLAHLAAAEASEAVLELLLSRGMSATCGVDGFSPLFWMATQGPRRLGAGGFLTQEWQDKAARLIACGASLDVPCRVEGVEHPQAKCAIDANPGKTPREIFGAKGMAWP